MGVFSSTQANAYADKIKVVYDYLDEIRKVADRLTPVEDLTSFQTQISELHARLDLLVEASSLIVEMSPAGEAILTGTISSIRALLGIEDIPDDLVTQADLDAAIAAAGLGNGSGLGGIQNSINEINLLIDQLDQYRVVQQSTIEGLQLSYQNVAAGLETNQTNISSALQRLTVQEQYAALVDQRFDSISQELTSTTQGLQGANNIIAGHTASISTALNSISIQSQSIDALSSSFNNLETGQGAIATAIDEMNTSIQGLGDDIIAQSNRTTSLKSAIRGSANLLPNADFAVGANGWQIVVAQEDWANTLLTTNTFNMPEEVNCLEVLGEPSPLGQIVVESPAVLLEADNHYIISGYPCVDNGTVELSYKAFNNAGQVVGQGACPATFNVTTNTNFSAYTRTWLKFLSPAGATKLRLYLTVVGDGDWIVQGALFRPMVEKAWIDQAGPSVWTPNIGGSAQALAEAVETIGTEVAEVDGRITAQASQINLIESSLSTKAQVFVQDSPPPSTGRVNGDTWIDTANGNKFYVWNGAWVLRNLEAGLVIFAQASQPSSSGRRVGDMWYNTNENNAPYRWNGSSWQPMQDPRIGASASAINSLNTRVSNVEGVVTAQATSINQLTTTVNGNTATISQQGTSINGLKAQYGVVVDVNGYAGGFTSINTGSTVSFLIDADKFAVRKISGSSGLYWENGHLWNKGPTHSVIVGQDMTPDGDVIFWIGPNPPSPQSATKAGASMYVTEDGEAVFRGLVNQSLLTGSAMELGSTRIHTGGGRLAPFTIRDAKYYVSPGTNASRTLVLDGFVGPSYGSGYHFKRFARQKMDVWMDVQISGDTGNETAIIEYQLDGGGWATIESVTFNCNYRGSFPMMIRWTSPDSPWGTLAFRVRTTQNRTEAIRITVDVANYNESGNSAGSNSGTSGGGGSTPPGGGGGGFECVDYDSVLPDGRLVRDLQVGDLVECVDMATLERGMFPLLAMGFGEEDCYRVTTNSGDVIQSASTPMDMRDGTVVRTPNLAGLDLLHHSGRFETASIQFMGPRKVCKPDLGNRMFFAGFRADSTIATHNIRYKDDGLMP